MPKQLARFKTFEELPPELACCEGLRKWLASQPESFYVDPSQVVTYPARGTCPSCGRKTPELTAIYCIDNGQYTPVIALEIDEGVVN